MMIVKAQLYTHRLAIFFSIMVGVFFVLPIILPAFVLGPQYHGILNLPLSDEDIYVVRIHEILDGHWSVASPFFYEYKDFPVAMYPINEWLYAIPAFIFGLSSVVIASKFVLPALLFLLTYACMSCVLGRRNDSVTIHTALAGALFVVLGAEFVIYQVVVAYVTGSAVGDIIWSRLVNPITGGVQLMAFLALLATTWNRGWRYAFIAAGVLLASMVGYFFSFGTALAVLGSLFLFGLLKREYDVARSLFWIGTISIVLDSWWWYRMLFTFGGEGGKAQAMMNGMFFTHAPVLNKAVFAATLLVGALFCYSYFYLKQREDIRTWIFVAALITGCWIVFNEQIITGREIWYYHFVQYTVPLCMISFITAGYLAFRRYVRAWMTAVIFISAFCTGFGLLSTQSYVKEMSYVQSAQHYAGVFSWLTTHAPKDCVVLINPNNARREEYERVVPAYTSCNSYTAHYFWAGITKERIEHNFLLQLQMQGIESADINDYLKAHEDDIRTTFFTDWDQAFGHGEEQWITDRIDQLTKDYQGFIKVPLTRQIKKYRFDYLLSEGPLSKNLLRIMPEIEESVVIDGHYLYHFNTDSL